MTRRRPAPTHKGDVTHHQDQSTILANLRAIKIKNSPFKIFIPPGVPAFISLSFNRYIIPVYSQLIPSVLN